MDQTSKPEKQTIKRKLRNDIILIAALIALVVLVGFLVWLFRGAGDTVVVEVDGKVYGTYDLDVDRTVEIRTGEGGEELNLLVIEGGKARVETATCPDGICAAHRPISHQGESIVCLPHKVVITVKLAGDGDGPDIVS